MTIVETAVRDDAPTVLALGALAAMTSDLAHEALGHGGMCLLFGGRIALLNNAFFHCSAHAPWIDLAGPLGNILCGLLACAALSFIPRTRPRLRLYALLVMAFSLYWEAGYLIFAMVKAKGDSFDAYAQWFGPPGLSLRMAGAALGVLAYFAITRLVRWRAGTAPPARQTLASAYFGGIAAMALAALCFAPDRLGAVHDAALSIAAAFPLLLMTPDNAAPGDDAPAIAASPLTQGVALLALALFALTLGRGLHF